MRDKKSGVVLLLVPKGEFTMGSHTSESGRDTGETQHPRTIRSAFYLGETEVTQEQWEGVVGTNPSKSTGPKRPVENVSWEDVQSFLRATGLRLPSEAEWEYACRAGTKTAFSCGNTLSDRHANTGSSTVDVGTLARNAWGFADMHGNVYEWCCDAYAAYPSSGDERPNESGGALRVLRGGGWGFVPVYCRSADRNRSVPEYRNDDLGFRVARTTR